MCYTFKEEYTRSLNIDKMELSYGDVFHILEISKALWKTYIFLFLGKIKKLKIVRNPYNPKYPYQKPCSTILLQ